MISALGKGPLRQTNALNADLWKTLIYLVNVKGLTQVVIQYVAAHCGVPGNERADVLADEALQKYNPTKMKASFKKSAIPLGSVKSELKRAIKADLKNSLNPAAAHCGVPGNERADVLANEALQKDNPTKMKASFKKNAKKLLDWAL
jgi:ribonuclease HI